MAADRSELVLLLMELVVINRRILRALSPDDAAAHRREFARPTVARRVDLDAPHGDPEIRGKDPHRWTGPSMRGRRFSECPPDYLDLIAESLDWQADQAEKKRETTNNGRPLAPLRRKDAARARGWAARLRAAQAGQEEAAPVQTATFRFELDAAGCQTVKEPSRV